MPYRFAKPAQFQPAGRVTEYHHHGSIGGFEAELRSHGSPGRTQEPWEFVAEEETATGWRRAGILRKWADGRVEYQPDPPAPTAA